MGAKLMDDRKKTDRREHKVRLMLSVAATLCRIRNISCHYVNYPTGLVGFTEGTWKILACVSGVVCQRLSLKDSELVF